MLSRNLAPVVNHNAYWCDRISYMNYCLCVCMATRHMTYVQVGWSCIYRKRSCANTHCSNIINLPSILLLLIILFLKQGCKIFCIFRVIFHLLSLAVKSSWAYAITHCQASDCLTILPSVCLSENVSWTNPELQGKTRSPNFICRYLGALAPTHYYIRSQWPTLWKL